MELIGQLFVQNIARPRESFVSRGFPELTVGVLDGYRLMVLAE